MGAGWARTVVAGVGVFVVVGCGSADGNGARSRVETESETESETETETETETESESESESETETETETEAESETASEAESETASETETESDSETETETGTGTESEAAGASGRAGPWTEEMALENAAYARRGAPAVIVHAPPAFDARGPLHIVVFLHGWSGCARQLVRSGDVPCRDGGRARSGWGLGERFDQGEVDALLVVPQLAFLERNGSPGRFAEPGRFAAFLDELLDRLGAAVGGATREDVASVTLLAHSAGFETALALLARGEVDVRNVVLFDALYRGVAPFTSWVAGDPRRRLVSLYTGGRTAQQSRRLGAFARGRLGADAVAEDTEPSAERALISARVVVARSPVAHGDVPAHHLPPLLPALLAASP